MAFIDAHRDELAIEPTCRELAIAPSSYHEYAARLADPGRRPARARRDDEFRKQIRRVHENNFGLYGSRKAWHQMLHAGKPPAGRPRTGVHLTNAPDLTFWPEAIRGQGQWSRRCGWKASVPPVRLATCDAI